MFITPRIITSPCAFPCVPSRILTMACSCDTNCSCASGANYLSGNRLGRLMKQWGYTTEKKDNSKGWCGIRLVKNYLALNDY